VGLNVIACHFVQLGRSRSFVVNRNELPGRTWQRTEQKKKIPRVPSFWKTTVRNRPNRPRVKKFPRRVTSRNHRPERPERPGVGKNSQAQKVLESSIRNRSAKPEENPHMRSFFGNDRPEASRALTTSRKEKKIVRPVYFFKTNRPIRPDPSGARSQNARGNGEKNPSGLLPFRKRPVRSIRNRPARAHTDPWLPHEGTKIEGGALMIFALAVSHSVSRSANAPGRLGRVRGRAGRESEETEAAKGKRPGPSETPHVESLKFKGSVGHRTRGLMATRQRSRRGSGRQGSGFGLLLGRRSDRERGFERTGPTGGKWRPVAASGAPADCKR